VHWHLLSLNNCWTSKTFYFWSFHHLCVTRCRFKSYSSWTYIIIVLELLTQVCAPDSVSHMGEYLFELSLQSLGMWRRYALDKISVFYHLHWHSQSFLVTLYTLISLYSVDSNIDAHIFASGVLKLSMLKVIFIY
jgi:hypothetical protein